MTPSIKDPPTNIAGYDPTRNTAGCSWDGEAAARAVDFFPAVLTHPDDSPGAKAGSPFVLSPWQRDYIATLYGWRRPDGTRRYQETAFLTPRKNGKTSLFAGVAIYELTAMKRIGAQLYSAAADREQASLVFRIAAAMVRKSRRLQKLLSDPVDSTRRIVYRNANSFYRAIPADAASAHGFKPACVFFDEVHTQRKRELWDALTSGFGSTIDPLFAGFSTAGWDRHSICFDFWKTARRVRDTHGADSPYFLPLIYELAEGEDWKDEETWERCNPGLGHSISWDKLRQEFAKAIASPAEENKFRNWYLNQWVEQAVRWLPMDAWDECAGELPDLKDEPCWAGLDMSATTDLTALSLVFRIGDDKFAVLPHFWIPEDTARAKENQDHVPYREWASKGYVTLTPGNQVDHDYVIRHIMQCREDYDLQEVAFDRWGSLAVAKAMTEENIPCALHGQGFASMSAPSKELEKAVLARRIIHGGNPVLRWNASNVAVQRDGAECIKPVKDKSTGRIDGIVATIMGLGRAVATLNVTSVYETRGIASLGESSEPQPAVAAKGPDWFNTPDWDRDDD